MLLAEFAKITGDTNEMEHNLKKAQFVKDAFNKKWVSDDGNVVTASL